MRTILSSLALTLFLFAGTAHASTVHLLDKPLTPAVRTVAFDGSGGDASGHWRRPVGLTALILGAPVAVAGGTLTVVGIAMASTPPENGWDVGPVVGIAAVIVGVPILALGVASVIWGISLTSPTSGAGGDAPDLAARPTAPTQKPVAPAAFTPLAWSGKF